MLEVVDRELRFFRQFDHPRKLVERRLAGAQGLFAILHEMPQRGAHGVVDEQAVPVNMQQRRDAHAAEEKLLFREVPDVEQFADQGVGMPQQLQRGGGVRFADDAGDRLLDRLMILENAQCGEGVEPDPHIALIAFQKRQPLETMPAAGLAPDGKADDVLRLFELAGDALAVPAGERGILAGTLIFAAGLEFDHLRLADGEEGGVDREVAEEVALAVFHRNDEVRGIDPGEGASERFPVPDEIADRMRADGPGAQDQGAVALLEFREQLLDEPVGISRGFQMQVGPDRIRHVEPVALADAEDESGELRKVVEDAPDQVAVIGIERVRGIAEQFQNRRSGGEDIGGQEDPEAELMFQQVEDRLELLAENRDGGRDFRLVSRVRGKVGQIIQGKGIETGRRRLSGEPSHVL